MLYLLLRLNNFKCFYTKLVFSSVHSNLLLNLFSTFFNSVIVLSSSKNLFYLNNFHLFVDILILFIYCSPYSFVICPCFPLALWTCIRQLFKSIFLVSLMPLFIQKQFLGIYFAIYIDYLSLIFGKPCVILLNIGH